MKIPRLPFTVEPQPDESLRGLVLRLAEANGYPAGWWVRGLYATSIEDRYRATISGRSLLGISGVSGLPKDRLASMGWWLDSPEDAPATHHMGDVLVPLGMLNTPCPKLCPRCLVERNYVRSFWELTAFCVCPIHGVRLVDRCPACGDCLRWDRRGVSLCHCGFDFRAIAKAARASDDLVELHHIILSHIPVAMPKPPAFRCGLPREHFSRMSLADLLAILMYLGNFQVISKGSFSSLRLLKLEAEIVYPAQRAVAGILAQWPTNFRDYVGGLVAMKKDRDDPIASKQLDSMFVYFTALTRKNAHFDFLRQEFFGLYGAKVRNALKNLARRSAAGDAFADSMTARDAASLLGLRTAVIRVYLRQGIVRPAPRPTWIRGKRKRLFVSRASVEWFLKKRGNLVSKWRAARSLGVTIYILERLRKQGILRAEQTRDGTPAPGWKYDSAQIADLLGDLWRHTTPSDATSTEELVPVLGVTMNYVEPGAPWTRFFQALREGRIRTVMEGPAEAGLAGLFVRRHEVVQFMREVIAPDTKLYSLTEAASRLGYDEKTTSALTRKGLLPKVCASYYRKRALIRESDIVRFQRSHTTAGQLARATASNSHRVTRILESLGVQPLIRARRTYSIFNLYRRRDIKVIALRAALKDRYG